jgi:serine/threonine-protein kinase
VSPASPAKSLSGLVGRTLGDFIVREKIGEGGFGAVFRAEQPLLAREAVIKVMNIGLRENQEAVGRFLREARLASRLDHPYAAHIYAFGAEPDGLMWIAMELVRGTPMNQLLKTQGPIALERFVQLLDRICEVVHSAHEHGIVHRDLKPANVMVMARAGRMLPKLLDFGIAKVATAHAPGVEVTPQPGPLVTTGSGDVVLDTDRGSETAEVEQSEEFAHTELPSANASSSKGSGVLALDESAALTQQGSAIGSPYYMAPEQWADPKSVDARTDLYALGVLAYESLTGEVPFRAADRVQLARAHMRKAVPSLGEEFPAALDPVLRKAMAKKQADRYATALEFAAAFRAASGVTEEKENLPHLDDSLLAELADAPQPISEAVGALDGARNVHQARDALWEVVRVIMRYLGVLALAGRTRVGEGAGTDTPR